LLRRTGVTEEYLHSLLSFETSTLFDEPTKAALRLAQYMTDHPEREVTDALFTDLRSHFEEAEIMEIAAMIGLFHYTNRFNNAFGIEPTV
jgi:alkylhydroperoxidase family enzyme